MTAGALVVHVGGADMAVDAAVVEHLEHVVGVLDHEGGQVLHVRHSLLLLDFKLRRPVLGQQVPHLLVVDFQVGCPHQILLLSVRLDALKDSLERPGHDSLLGRVLGETGNSVSLSRSSLPIGEDRPIVSLKHILDDWICTLGKDVFLFGGPVVNAVESEDLRHFLRLLLDVHLSLVEKHLHHAFSSVPDFVVGHWSAPDDHSDSFKFSQFFRVHIYEKFKLLFLPWNF